MEEKKYTMMLAITPFIVFVPLLIPIITRRRAVYQESHSAEISLTPVSSTYSFMITLTSLLKSNSPRLHQFHRRRNILKRRIA